MKVSWTLLRIPQLLTKADCVGEMACFIVFWSSLSYRFAADNNLASVVRNFTGFGRELFTDTGQ